MALSAKLDDWGVRHAYIGGFAFSLLGSVRPTQISLRQDSTLELLRLPLFRIYDIDVLIEDKDPQGLADLKERLMEEDEQFGDVGICFYYVTQNPDGHLVREELVRSSINNVHVETLLTGHLGLPDAIVDTYEVGEFRISILHPAILVLTKFKRWSINYTSTRPKTMKKVATDERDIRYIIDWLAERRECIRFGHYVGKTKPELLAMIRKYYEKYRVEDDSEDHLNNLRSIMGDNWDEMLALPSPEPEESTAPP